MLESYELYGWSGYPIRDFNDWEKNGMRPERKLKQFVPGRSAYELAVLYMMPGYPTIPAVLRCLLDSHNDTKGVVIEDGKVERETPLPHSTRGNRCHDVSFRGSLPSCGAFISIEGKADETFGKTVAKELEEALGREATDFPKRLEWLTQSLLGQPPLKDELRNLGNVQLTDVNPLIQNLQYQLFAGLAATLLEAEDYGARRAIFVVQEFRTTETSDKKMRKNTEALDSFLRILFQSNGAPNPNFELEIGRLLRFPILPRKFRDGARILPSNIPLYIGKIRTDLLVAGAKAGN